MPDGTNGAGGQAPTSDPAPGQAPQANNSGSPSAAPAGQAPEANNQTPQTSAADYDRMIAELRKENAAHRTKLKQFEDAQAAAELAKLSDADKAVKRAESAEAALTAARSRIGASELKVAAQAAGIVDPDVAAALLGAKIEYDAAGEPTNVAELVTGLKKDKPHLFGSALSPRQPAPTAGGATNPGRAAGNGGLTLEQIQAMPMRERVRRINEIRAWEEAQRQQNSR